MYKILVCDAIDDNALATLQQEFAVEVKTGMAPEELIQTIPPFHCMIVRSATKVRQPVIDAASSLKLIIRGGVGLDNIDVAYAEAKGVTVKNTPRASSNAVAELAVGYFFALARHIPKATATMKQGKWEKKKLKGTEVQDKTLGVLGIGRIGQMVAQKAMALGMKVVSFDPFYQESPIPGVTMMAKDDVLKQADYLTLHMPFIKEQGPVLAAKEFAVMKPGMRLVNCARGGVVDEAALLDALNSGTVAACAVDVFASEPGYNRDLVNHDNCIGSPHIGAATKESQARIGQELVDIARIELK